MPIFEVFVVFSGFKYLQKLSHRHIHKCTQFSYWTIYDRLAQPTRIVMEHKESITTHSHVYNQTHSVESQDKHEDISPSKSKIYCTFKRYSVSLLVWLKLNAVEITISIAFAMTQHASSPYENTIPFHFKLLYLVVSVSVTWWVCESVQETLFELRIAFELDTIASTAKAM